MQAPTVETDPFVTLEVVLDSTAVGQTPFGGRSEVFFEGTATSSLWDGQWAVKGVDHITVGDGGVVRIDVHVTLSGSGPDGADEVLTYRGHGRGGPDGVVEGVTFDTPTERLGELNTTVAVGRGALEENRLTIWLYRLVP